MRDRLQAMLLDVRDAQRSAIDSFDGLLERGEKLQALVNKSQALDTFAQRMNEHSARLRSQKATISRFVILLVALSCATALYFFYLHRLDDGAVKNSSSSS